MTYIALTDLSPKNDTDNLVVKIGRSIDPRGRMVSLKSDPATPYGKLNYALLFVSEDIDEWDIHDQYKDHRYEYEWTTELFEFSEEQLLSIGEIKGITSFYNLNGEDTLNMAKSVLKNPNLKIDVKGTRRAQPTNTKDGRKQISFKLPIKTIEQITQVSYWERIEQWKFVADAVQVAYDKLKETSPDPLPSL